MINRRIILAGGSGFLGSCLTNYLRKNHFEVLCLTRSKANAPGFVQWDPPHMGPWYKNLDGAAALINFSGRPVDCRPTKKNRMEILRSRVQSIVTLAEAIRKCENPPLAWIQASSAAIYGDKNENDCTESTHAGEGFAVDVCKRWEKEFQLQRLEQVRKVTLRIGLVLAANGGALQRLARLTEMGLGSPAGNGQQYMSWIHHVDFCRIVQWCVENHLAQGVYNVSAPSPVTNSEFMKQLRTLLGRRVYVPAPGVLVRLASVVLRTDPSLILAGRKCLPQRLIDLGFQFDHPELPETLEEILGKESQASFKIG
jgi:hypothetical protein